MKDKDKNIRNKDRRTEIYWLRSTVCNTIYGYEGYLQQQIQLCEVLWMLAARNTRGCRPVACFIQSEKLLDNAKT